MKTINRLSPETVEPTENGVHRPVPKDVARIGMHDGIVFEVWTIAPELAACLLENVHNRPRRKTRKNRYARIMKTGRWELNYEWVGIDEHGYVIEGQHRLQACVDADTPFRALVLTGYPRSLFPSLGVAAPRGVADNVALVGATSANAVAAALVFLYRAESGMALYTTGEGARPESDEALEILKRHPGVEQSVRKAGAARRIFPHIGMLAYLHYEFSRRDATLADTFIERLSDGADLKASSPILLLREKLQDNKIRKDRKLTQKQVLAFTIKTWNYVRAGRRAPKFLRWSDGQNEAFPEIQ